MGELLMTVGILGSYGLLLHRLVALAGGLRDPLCCVNGGRLALTSDLTVFGRFNVLRRCALLLCR